MSRDENDKHIYIAISVEKLKNLFAIPKEIDEVLTYLEQIRPHRWDYKKIRKKIGSFWEKYKSFLE